MPESCAARVIARAGCNVRVLAVEQRPGCSQLPTAPFPQRGGGRPTDTQVPGIQGHSLSTETALDRHNASLTQRVSPTVSKTNPNSHVPCTTVCNLIFQSVSHQDTSRYIEIHHDTFRYMYLYLVWHFGRLSRIRNRNDIQVNVCYPRKMYLYVSYFKIHSGYIATP